MENNHYEEEINKAITEEKKFLRSCFRHCCLYIGLSLVFFYRDASGSELWLSSRVLCLLNAVAFGGSCFFAYDSSRRLKFYKTILEEIRALSDLKKTTDKLIEKIEWRAWTPK